MRTCDLCGRREPEERTRLTWTSAIERGRTRSYCADCTREHVRSMEGKLDSEWW